MVRFLIERPIAVTMALIGLVVLSVVATGLLPVSLMPDVPIPQITVQVSAPNMSARELEASAIRPLRQQLMQVTHLADITSETKDGAGNLFLQFEYGAEIDFLFIEVNEKIDRAMNQLPRSMERPKVMKASATDIPAFYLNLTLKKDNEESGNDPLFPVSAAFSTLSHFSEQVISKRIEQLPQVAMVDISGQVFSELLILPDLEKLHAAGASVSDLEQALANNNITLGNLTIRDGQYQYSIRFSSVITGKEDIENVYLLLGERILQVKDLARVIDHPQKRKGLVRSDGKLAITMAIIKQSEARMSELKEQLDGLMENFRTEYPDIDFTITRDQTQLLDYSIDNLKSNLLIGALFACMMLFLFMRDLRSPFLILITIPLSLLCTLLCFHLAGISINIISLSGLILGVGMMVDNSIIVIDNISQRWARGESLKKSVVNGTNEVFTPMLSSVLTTCSVFIPLIFLSGIAGSLFYDQAMAVSIGLLASLAVAMMVIPVYYYLFYRKSDARSENKWLKKIQFFNYEKLYERGFVWSMRHQAFMWLIFFAMTGGLLILYKVMDKTKLPPITHDDVIVNIDWNEKINPDENDRRVSELIQSLAQPPLQYTSMVGTQQFLLSHTREIAPSEAIIYLQSTAQGISAMTGELLNKLHSSYPDAVAGAEEAGNIFNLIFSENEADLVVRLRATDGRSPKPEKLGEALLALKKALPEQTIEPLSWQEHIVLKVRPERMMLYEVEYNTLYSKLKNALGENQLFSIIEGQYAVPVVMGEEHKTIDAIIQGSTVTNRKGAAIPVYELLRQTRDRDLKTIVSGKEGDYYPVGLSLNGKKPAEMMKTAKAAIAENTDFEVDFSGSFFSNRALIKELIVILVVALLLLFFILAAQFESLVQPLIILSEVTIDIFGALFLLWIFGAGINLMSLIGIVVMCGIIVNDSILKIDTINRLRKDGNNLIKSMLLAGQRRLKPILMTSLTTILALVPFLFTGDMGSDLQYPLSLALIGGMFVGTLVSLFFIPLIYYYLYRNKAKK